MIELHCTAFGPDGPGGRECGRTDVVLLIVPREIPQAGIEAVCPQHSPGLKTTFRGRPADTYQRDATGCWVPILIHAKQTQP